MDNYLKREDFINLVDSNKIWSKSMSKEEIMTLLNTLELELAKHNYVSDKNFFMDGRRIGLKGDIEYRLLNKNYDYLESLFNFWEFVNNEYYGSFHEIQETLNISSIDLTNMWNTYKETGIICLEEKNTILEMINNIKEIINLSGV